jgi:hypothetical protein
LGPWAMANYCRAVTKSLRGTPCLLATLGRRPIGACRIFSHNFPQKNSGWGGGGVYYSHPSLPISIRYKQDGVRIQVKQNMLIKNTHNDTSSRGFLYISVTWRFLLMYFLFKVSASFLILFGGCLLYCFLL